MYSLYNIGARKEPWVTPGPIFLGAEILPPTEILNFLSLRQDAISLMRLVENTKYDNLHSRPECHVVSKASSITDSTAASIYYYSNLGWRDPPATHSEVSSCDLLDS
jgi:hypothetical protein